MENRDFKSILVSSETSLRKTIQVMDSSKMAIALVVDKDNHLLDVITDGDVRRAMLANIDLDGPVSALENRRANSRYPRPITAPIGITNVSLLRLMQEHGIRHMPLVDKENRVVQLMVLSDILPDETLPLQAVVMAGGYGQRMRPLTDNVPKPMLPMGDKPLLEVILQQLRASGITQVNLTTHYKGDQILDHFGDGKKFGLDIRYIQEDQPLGTAGSLSLLDKPQEPLLIMNGDIVTQINFRAMLKFHVENQADMTVAIRPYEFHVPYGIVEMDGVSIRSLSEKPVLKHFINAGIYLINPKLCKYVPKDQSYDMTDLIKRALAEKHRVISFPLHEYWMDIGQIDKYEMAKKTFDSQPPQS